MQDIKTILGGNELLDMAVALEHHKTINQVIKKVVGYYTFPDEMKARIVNVILSIDEEKEEDDE